MKNALVLCLMICVSVVPVLPSFVITSQERPVKFSEVKEIQKWQLPIGAKMGIITAAVAGGLLLLMYLDYGRTH